MLYVQRSNKCRVDTLPKYTVEGTDIVRDQSKSVLKTQ